MGGERHVLVVDESQLSAGATSLLSLSSPLKSGFSKLERASTRGDANKKGLLMNSSHNKNCKARTAVGEEGGGVLICCLP